MYSLRRFLLISLLLGVAVVTLLASLWAYHDVVQEIEAVVQAQPKAGYVFQNAHIIAIKHIYPLLALYPLLGLFIWISVSRALKPINQITTEIRRREHGSLTPLIPERIPKEIIPLISELNLLFSRLEHSYNTQKRFTADAAHELRTPLAALKTQTQVALRASSEYEKKTAFNNIIIGVDRCTHLIEQLSILANLRQDEPIQNPQAIDLNQLSREVISDLIHTALSRHTEIEFYCCQQKDPVIMGSLILIQVLMRNLIDNAIRYSPEYSLIKVSVRLLAETAIFSVEDNGPGVPNELKERIFERFYRQLGTKTSGSGLGLSIVSQIATLHRANITVQDAKPHGLLMSISIPLYLS